MANSIGHSLYRGATFGVRKRFSQRYQLEANYVLSKDIDTDSNERDPFDDFTTAALTGLPHDLPLDQLEQVLGDRGGIDRDERTGRIFRRGRNNNGDSGIMRECPLIGLAVPEAAAGKVGAVGRI